MGYACSGVDVVDERSLTAPSSDILPAGMESFEVHGYWAEADIVDRRYSLGFGVYGVLSVKTDVTIFWTIGGQLTKISSSKLFDKGVFAYGGCLDFSEDVGADGQVWFNTLSGAPVRVNISLDSRYVTYEPETATITVRDAQGTPLAGEIVKIADYDLCFVTGSDGSVEVLYTTGTYTVEGLKGAITKSLSIPGSVEFQYAGLELTGISFTGIPLIGVQVTIREVDGDDEHKAFFSDGFCSFYTLKPNTTYEINILGFTMQVTMPDEGEILNIMFDAAHAVEYGWTPPADYPPTMGDVSVYVYDRKTLEPVRVIIAVYDGTLSFRMSTSRDGIAKFSLFTTQFTIEIDDSRYLKYKETLTPVEGQVLEREVGLDRRPGVSIR